MTWVFSTCRLKCIVPIPPAKKECFVLNMDIALDFVKHREFVDAITKAAEIPTRPPSKTTVPTLPPPAAPAVSSSKATSASTWMECPAPIMPALSDERQIRRAQLMKGLPAGLNAFSCKWRYVQDAKGQLSGHPGRAEDYYELMLMEHSIMQGTDYTILEQALKAMEALRALLAGSTEDRTMTIIRADRAAVICPSSFRLPQGKSGSITEFLERNIRSYIDTGDCALLRSKSPASGYF